MSYYIEFDCGCTVNQYACIRNNNVLSCPDHIDAKKKTITFQCDICGITSDKTVKGEPIIHIGTRYVCLKCQKLLKSAVANGMGLKDVVENKLVLQRLESRERNKAVTTAPRKTDCKNYDHCLSKAAFSSDPRESMQCRNCIRYEHQDLDIMNFVQYNGGIDKTKIDKRVTSFEAAKLANQIEKMLTKKKRANKAAFNFASGKYVSKKFHEQNIQAGIERGKSI